MDWTSCSISQVPQLSCLTGVFGRTVEFISMFAVLVFFIMLIVGGVKFLFSSGNPKASEAAKGTITSAFLGLLLIVLAYLIIKVLGSVTGFKLTFFEIPYFN